VSIDGIPGEQSNRNVKTTILADGHTRVTRTVFKLRFARGSPSDILFGFFPSPMRGINFA